MLLKKGLLLSLLLPGELRRGRTEVSTTDKVNRVTR